MRRQLTAWRMVEAQHVLATAKLVDNAEEQELLERMIDAAKPSAPKSPSLRATGLHYLLAGPFRYPPLRHGSRFGSAHHRGIWYGARQLDTVLAEVAFYRLLFLAGTKAKLGPVETTHTAYSVPLKSARAVDLSRPYFHSVRNDLLDPTSHIAGRAFGDGLRDASIDLLLFPSARAPATRGKARDADAKDANARDNVAAFSARAFAAREPTAESFQTWRCMTRAELVTFWRLPPKPRSLAFSRQEFLIRGKLPDLS
ncbi:MAG: RES family NAD+ phosphorylase [Planctomycetota bacterium]